MLSEVEKKLLQLFLDFNKRWLADIPQQLNSAKIERQCTFSSYYIDFDVSKEAKTIDTNVEVPVEVIFGDVIIPTDHVIGNLHGNRIIKTGTFFVPDEQAAGVRLHFRNGYICELEVYNLAGQELCIESLLGKQYIYILFDNEEKAL